MVLWLLFRTFIIIGLISFGGGYAMVPILHTEVTKFGWMSSQQFTEIIAIAGMAPGPVAANSAVLIGYSTAGITGAIVAVLGILLPALVLVLIVAAFFRKLNHHPAVHMVFYGLRPIVASLISFAAISFAMSNHLVTLSVSWHTISLVLVFCLSLFALLKLRWNPIWVIILSGLVGIALYS